MRTITIITTQGDGNSTINSSATTWGELKTELAQNNIKTSEMKAMVRHTKATLEMNDAVLPTEDFTIFLTASKVKSGAQKSN